MNGDVQGLIREASTLEDQENDSSSGKDRFLVSHFHFYWTRVRSLGMLVSDSLTDSLLFSKLD